MTRAVSVADPRGATEIIELRKAKGKGQRWYAVKVGGHYTIPAPMPKHIQIGMTIAQVMEQKEFTSPRG